jgi:WD40 repeat protein
VLVEHVEAQQRVNKMLPIRREDDLELPVRFSAREIIDASRAELWDAMISRVCAALGVTAPVPGRPPPCPYPGMRPFAEDQEDRFFGRDHEITELCSHLRRCRFATVIGRSGSGKSSLVRAGVMPRLRRQGFDGEPFAVELIRPGRQPLGALRAALARLHAAPASALRGGKVLVVDQLEESFAPGVEDAERFFVELAGAVERDNRLHAIVTVRADFYPDLMSCPLWPVVAPSRVEVVPLRGECLREAIRCPAQVVGVVVEEALVERLAAETEGQPGLLAFLQETLRTLWETMSWRLLSLAAYTKMTGDDGRSGVLQAIQREAEAAFEEVRVTRRDGERVVRSLLMRLVQFGEGGPDTRRQVALSELETAAPDPATFTAVYDTLVRHRLLTPGSRPSPPEVEGAEQAGPDVPLEPSGRPGAPASGPTGRQHRAEGHRQERHRGAGAPVDDASGEGGPMAEIAVADLSHEAIMRGWPRFAGWIATYRSVELNRRRWLERATTWSRGDGSLLTGADLAGAETWLAEAAGTGARLEPVVERYVGASRARVRRAERRRRSLFVGVAAAGLVLAIVFGLLARSSRQAQHVAEQEAGQRVATELRTAAATYSAGLPLRTLLVRAADLIAPSRLSALEMLVGVEDRPPIERKIDATKRGVGFEAVATVGDRLVIGDGVGEVAVWPPGNDPAVTTNVGHGVLTMAAKERSTIVAVGGGDVTAVGDDFTGTGSSLALVDIAARPLEVRRVEPGTDQPVSAVLFDGDRLIVGAWDGTVRIIDTTGAGAPQPTTLTLPPAPTGATCDTKEGDRKIRSLAVDGARRWLVAGTNDCLVVAWDLADPTGAARTMTAHTGKVRAVAFVPGGSELLSTGDDRTIRSWDLTASEPTATVQVADADAQRDVSLCIAPDGTSVVTAGRDHQVRRWLRSNGALQRDPSPYAAHVTTIRSVLCPTATTFVSVAGDGAVLWDLARPLRLGRPLDPRGTPPGGPLSAVAVRPGVTGSRQVAVATPESVELVGDGRPPLRLDLGEAVVGRIAYGPDGTTLVVATTSPGASSSALEVFDAGTGVRRARFEVRGRDTALAVGVGGTIAAGGEAGDVTVLSGDGRPVSLALPRGVEVQSAAFGPHGELLLGDVAGTLVCTVPGATSATSAAPAMAGIELGRPVAGLAVGGDGTVVTGTQDGILTVYRHALTVRTGACDPATWSRGSLPVLHDAVASLALTLDGSVLVAAGSDGVVDVWDVPRSRLVGSLPLGGGTDRARFVALDPSLDRVVLAGSETVTVFDLDRDRLRAALCDVAGRNLLPDEEQTFLPERYRERARCA